MWRRDTWRLIDGGRVKIVKDNQPVFEGRHVRWDRFAIWGIFERLTDGAVVPFVATHHMTNVKKFPAHSQITRWPSWCQNATLRPGPPNTTSLDSTGPVSLCGEQR